MISDWVEGNSLTIKLYYTWTIYLNFLLAFLTQTLTELQALTDHFCFVEHDPSPMLTIIIILLFPTQSLHETPYQLHLYLIIYLFWKVMYGCISHISIAILCILCRSAYNFHIKKTTTKQTKQINWSCEARQCCICLQENAWSESNIVPTPLTTKMGKCYQAHNQVSEKGSYMGVWWHA